MAGSTIDHLVALGVFIGAMLLFISLFNQTLQTAILYQEHRQLATKCSDMLDNILLNPGYPQNWGMTNSTPTSFGLQDPEFTEYRLSPYSLMRLQSATGTPIVYPKTGLTYSNVSSGFGNFLFVPYTLAIDYVTATKLLGINNTYGFQLTISPIVTVQITETQATNPLTLNVHAFGSGFPLSNATLSYCFLKVVPKGQGNSPFYESTFGTTYTDDGGSSVLTFSGVAQTDSYVLIVYAHMSGLTGIGYKERIMSDKRYVIPLIDSFQDRRVLLAHSYDVHYYGPPESAVFFNATFVILSQDFTLREMPLENSTGKTGKVNYGAGQPYSTLTIPTYNPGILVITYESNNEYGVVLMPWGLSSLAFSITFGGQSSGMEWVATDTRQVVVNGIAYQVKLAMWSYQGQQVIA
jgi:hypothetical protein